MSELEEIKAKAAEIHGDHRVTVGVALSEYRNLLDRAIAIADRAETAGYAFYGHDKDSLVVQLREARAAVLVLRTVVLAEMPSPPTDPETLQAFEREYKSALKVLANTESYERYR